MLHSVHSIMGTGTIVFVHGTGVRLKDYRKGMESAKRVATSAGITETFVECAWGDPLGVELSGHSLPDEPSQQKLAEEEQDFARWRWLFDDPLFELDKLTIQDVAAPAAIPMPGVRAGWQLLWETIIHYEPSLELRLLLQRSALDVFWPETWARVVTSPIAQEAFKASASELPEASNALARALVAQLHVLAVTAGASGPSRVLRWQLVERLISDWNQQVYGLGAFFAKMFKRAMTSVLKAHRNSFSNAVALPVGDILLYQSRGEEVRKFIRQKIEHALPPVTVVAHSLGGIACVDLLALANPPSVAHLVTAGSQSPLFYEMGALLSLKPAQPLPAGFPPWLNFYDRNDFLSYVAHRFWPQVEDEEVESGQPFPDSHSAYFGDSAVWEKIRRFIDAP